MRTRLGAGAAGGSLLLSHCRVFVSELSWGGPSWQPQALLTPCSHPLSSAPHVHIVGFLCPASCCIFQIHNEITSQGWIFATFSFFTLGKASSPCMTPPGCGMFPQGKGQTAGLTLFNYPFSMHTSPQGSALGFNFYIVLILYSFRV